MEYREQFQCVSEEELAEEERLSKEVMPEVSGDLTVSGIESIEADRIDKVLSEIAHEKGLK